MNLGVVVTWPKGWMPSSVGVLDSPSPAPAAAFAVSAEVSAPAGGAEPICCRHSVMSQDAKARRLLVPPAMHTSSTAQALFLVAAPVLPASCTALSWQPCILQVFQQYACNINCTAAWRHPPISMTTAAEGTATAAWLALAMLMLLLPTALSCSGASLVQHMEVRSRQKVSAARRPATLLPTSIPPCTSSWFPSTAVAADVRAEGFMPVVCTAVQQGVGRLRAGPRLKEGVLQDVMLLRSRQHTCACMTAKLIRLHGVGRVSPIHQQMACRAHADTVA